MGIRFVTYFTPLGQELVMVPDFPAWVCDVCGNTIYDFKAVNMISTLLSPTTGHTNKPARGHQAASDDHANPTPQKGNTARSKE